MPPQSDYPHFNDPSLFFQNQQNVSSLCQHSNGLAFSALSTRQPSPTRFQLLADNSPFLRKYSQTPPLQPASSQLNMPLNSFYQPPDLMNQMNTLVFNLKLQNNLQSELYKTQIKQLLDVQLKLNQKLEEAQELSIKSTKAEQSPSLPDENLPLKKNEKPTTHLPVTKKTLRNQIRNLLNFVLMNFGKISEEQMNLEKKKYGDPLLISVFDALITKYSSTIKTKEEMVKYTLRKAFKYIKRMVKKERMLNSKEASKALCARYFNDFTQANEAEDDFLKVILPFRKNSKNKTMNANFIREIFSSEAFKEDYQLYLEDIDEVLEADNNGKFERFASFIEDCMKKDKIKEIQSYKRIPWPDIWIVNTKKIGIELPDAGDNSSLLRSSKKTKKNLQPYSASHREASESENDKTTQSSPKASINSFQ